MNEEREEGKKGEKDAAAFASPNRQKYGVHTPLSVQSIKDRGAKMKGKYAVHHIQNKNDRAQQGCGCLLRFLRTLQTLPAPCVRVSHANLWYTQRQWAPSYFHAAAAELGTPKSGAAVPRIILCFFAVSVT